MADEATAAPPSDVAKTQEQPTRVEEPSATDPTPAESGAADKPADSTEDPKATSTDAAADKDTAMEIDTSMEHEAHKPTTGGEAEDGPTDTTAAVNGTPASSKKGGSKRKSGGVPEHKKKNTPNSKKKPQLRLDVEPGQYWFVAMRGYPPWPVIICDEEMLPETLLSKRPVSAKRMDGTYREDFLEGGKNAKDRRYPVMFLGTNEFAWQVNTDLQPLDVEAVKKELESKSAAKKTKALLEAFKIASEQHDLAWFKKMLEEHEKALLDDMQARADAEAKRQEKKDKSKRKSTAGVEEEEDVDMEDAPEDGEAPAKKSKAPKKRKKDADSDGEPDKPAKTPKMKIKPPKEDSAAKPKSSAKPKKAAPKAKSSDEDNESLKVEEKPLTEAERKEKREKGVLYLRHRLQKGFLTRDQTPKEDEMDSMADFFKQLENYADLEAEIIRKTKIHKVLKAIVKLNSIPKEEDYHFKQRSNDLLNGWNRALTADADLPAGEASAEPTTNGVNHGEKDESKEETEKADATVDEKPKDAPAETEAPKPADTDADVAMGDAKDETPAAKEDAPPVETVETAAEATTAA